MLAEYVGRRTALKNSNQKFQKSSHIFKCPVVSKQQNPKFNWKIEKVKKKKKEKNIFTNISFKYINNCLLQLDDMIDSTLLIVQHMCLLMFF